MWLMIWQRLQTHGTLETGVLELLGASGAVYHYFGIPAPTFEELLRAESKGGYFNSHIRNRFAYAKVLLRRA